MRLVANQRRVRRKLRAPSELVAGRPAQQIERQVHARAAAGDVILQIRVEALVSEVELRRERDHDDAQIERRKAERSHQPRQQGHRARGSLEVSDGIGVAGTECRCTRRRVREDARRPRR